MKDTPLGPWEPLTVAGVQEALVALSTAPSTPWWIGGGYAIEAFAGRPLRDHDDVDVGLLRRDQAAARGALLRWDPHAADPPGALRPWLVGETLPLHTHDVWVRERPHSPWRFQLMLDESDGDEWLYRRRPALRLPLSDLTWQRDGVAYLIPEVQLLYKARGRRSKDQADFEAIVDLLSGGQRAWLAMALRDDYPDGHPWIVRLA